MSVSLSRPRRGWPIAVVMSAELLVAALVPMSIGVWLATRRSADALATEARTSLSLLATVTAAQLDQNLRGATHAMVQVADDDRVAALLGADAGEVREAVQRRLELAARSSPDFAFAMILDGRGDVVATTDASTVGQNFASRGYWRDAIAGERHISEMILGRTTGQPGVFVSAPVTVAERVVGVAVIKLDGERIRRMALSANPGGAASVLLANRNGVILAHSDESLQWRSLGDLRDDVVGTFDALGDYGVPRIDPAPLGALADIVRDPIAGARAVVLPALGGDGAEADAEDEWVVGHASLQTRPWTLAVMVPERQFVAPLDDVLREQALILLAVAALAAAYAVARARGIARPLVALTGAARRVADGDFGARSGIRRGDELGSLAKAFDGMVPRLHEHMELRQSLAVAMDVQQALLPHADPSVSGLDIAGRSSYCDETGGDYYDYVQIHPGRTAIVLGDVMGHGVASALLMATARAALRAHASLHSNLGDLMTRVNRLLSADARHGRFMTMVMAVIDTNERTIRWASAGHDPIMVFDPDPDAESGGLRELEDGELPLGVNADEIYAEHVAPLPPAAVLLVGTDGIWETAGPDGAMYGKQRLADIVRDGIARGASSQEIATALDRDVTAFRGTARILDDITFVIVRLDATIGERVAHPPSNSPPVATGA